MTDNPPETLGQLAYRGVLILRPEVPGAPYIWTHDERNASGAAPTLDDARRQITRMFGTPDPACPIAAALRPRTGPTWP